MTEIPSMTSNEYDRKYHHGEPVNLLCGRCRAVLPGDGLEQWGAPNDKKHGKVCEDCWVALLPPTKRAKYERDVKKVSVDNYIL